MKEHAATFPDPDDLLLLAELHRDLLLLKHLHPLTDVLSRRLPTPNRTESETS